MSDGSEIFLKARECGDEPYMLASAVPSLSVVIGSDRFASGMLAMESLYPDIFILGDGFQHIRLHRDLNILLMDYANPTGNGHVIPAGPLREPVSASARADLLVFTRSPSGAIPPDSLTRGRPACCAGYRISGFSKLDTSEKEELQQIRNCRVVAVTGIAAPESFFKGLAESGITPLATLSLPDHEPYGPDTVVRIKRLAQAHSADFVAVTAKDAVKLEKHAASGLPPVLVAQLQLEFGDTGPLLEMIEKVLKQQ